MSREPMKPFDENAGKPKNQNATSGIGDVKDRVSDMASKVKDKAGQAADNVSERLDHQREHAAEGLDRAASTIHERADNVPGGAKVVKLTHSLADGMESTATYLRDHDFNQMGKDVMSLASGIPHSPWSLHWQLDF